MQVINKAPRQEEKQSWVWEEDKTRSACPTGQYIKPDLCPLRLTLHNHLSSSPSLSSPPMKHNPLCQHLPNIPVGDNQFLQSFVQEVNFEALLTLNYSLTVPCKADLSSSPGLTQTDLQIFGESLDPITDTYWNTENTNPDRNVTHHQPAANANHYRYECIT